MDHRFDVETFWEFSGGEGMNFSRDHVIRFPGKTEIHGSSAPAFAGNAANLNPEELFVSAISSCQMLTYLFLCFKNKLQIQSYEYHAEGELVRESAGKFWMKTVTLKPIVKFRGADTQQVRALAIRLIHEAHVNCFIAQSVKTTVNIEPSLLFM